MNDLLLHIESPTKILSVQIYLFLIFLIVFDVVADIRPYRKLLSINKASYIFFTVLLRYAAQRFATCLQTAVKNCFRRLSQLRNPSSFSRREQNLENFPVKYYVFLD